MHIGTVTRQHRTRGTGTLFHVEYEDGDAEDMHREEVQWYAPDRQCDATWVVGKNEACARASLEGEESLTRSGETDSQGTMPASTRRRTKLANGARWCMLRNTITTSTPRASYTR